MTAMALFASRVRKPRRPRSRFAKCLALLGSEIRTPLGVRRRGWDLVVAVDRAQAFPMASVVVHVGDAGEVACGGLGGTYPVVGDRHDVLELSWWPARTMTMCSRCAKVVKRGYRQHGAGRPPVSRTATMIGRFRNGALPEQTVRPTHVVCTRCDGAGSIPADLSCAEERRCVRCRGTGVYPPPAREIAS
jgi:hypothetical protein